MNTIQFFNYQILSESLSSINLDSKKVINTINPHSFVLARNDDEFRLALEQSDILIPDGIGIAYGVRVLNNQKIKRIAGYDLFKFFIESEGLGKRVFFLGSTDSTLDKIKNRINTEHPHLIVGCFSPPFKMRFSKDENDKMTSIINDFKPDILFVGMTAPKQEKWVFINHSDLEVKYICSVGAVFDFYAGNIKRAPKFLIAIGLEWTYRLFLEPKRMFTRNFVSTPVYLFIVVVRFFQKQLTRLF
jgi:N-acetylglucosaminyldiphosphoundecaprenol N-acetyl-beta-D-mannosaminyltransferase